jgi:hypothetical protein
MIEAPDIQLGFGSKILILLIIVFSGAGVIYIKKFISWLQGLEDE